jgi:hypothetical protein
MTDIEDRIAEAVSNGASEIVLRQPVQRDKDGHVWSSFMAIINPKQPKKQAVITAIRSNPGAALRAALAEHKMRYGSLPTTPEQDPFG